MNELKDLIQEIKIRKADTENELTRVISDYIRYLNDLGLSTLDVSIKINDTQIRMPNDSLMRINIKAQINNTLQLRLNETIG